MGANKCTNLGFLGNMVSLSIILNRISRTYTNFTKQIIHILNLLPESNTLCLTIQIFKHETIMLVYETQSFKSFSKPCSLLLTMFWSLLTFIPAKHVLIGEKCQILQRKSDRKIKTMIIWPKINYWICSLQNNM